MASLYLLIPLAIVFVALAALAFLWAVQHDQFEDLDREAARILFEEPAAPGHQPKHRE